MSKHLQSRIDNAGSILDLRGQEFWCDEIVTIDRPILIYGGWVRFEGPGNIVVNFGGVSIDGMTVTGPGRIGGEQFAGIHTFAPVNLTNCYVHRFEYAQYLFDVGSDGSRILNCKAYQSLEDFPAPWQGYEYGFVTQYVKGLVFRDCDAEVIRHSCILGHETKDTLVQGCTLRSLGDVQAMAFKPFIHSGGIDKGPTEDCIFDNNFVDGVIIGGLRTTISGNVIVGRAEHHQPSTPIWAPKDTIVDYNHTIIGNTIRTMTIDAGGGFGSKGHGAVYAYCESGEGSPIFTGNRLYIEGDAPAVVGMTSPTAHVSDSKVEVQGNVVVRL